MNKQELLQLEKLASLSPKEIASQAPELMRAKVYRLSDIAGLAEKAIDRALKKDLSLNSISAEKLDELVTSRILSRQEANRLGLASNLLTLFDSSFELTEVVKKSMPVKSLTDLVPLNRSDWEKLVAESKVELPQDLSVKDYADVLYKKVENLFPEEALIHRITLPTTYPLSTQIESINRLVNVHPGLKLKEILNDPLLSPGDKEIQINGRIGLMNRFMKNNAEVSFLSLSYTHDSEDVKLLNFQDFKPDEKAMVLNSVKSYQRVYSITNDIEHTEALMAAGFHSAFQITSVTLPEFIKSTKFNEILAAGYFENAMQSIIRTSGVVGSILDIITGSFDWMAVGNSSPDIKDYLRGIPGYQDLFGEMAFCDCDHCQSIYSPAAYFVDLMQFLERYIFTKHFTGANAGHVLNLKVRRPDLWTLPLSCENTNQLVPYLDIINEILEAYIAKKRGFAGDLNNRNAVESFIYKGEMALEKPGSWRDQIHSISQPFHLPLESVATYLGHFEKTREDIALLLRKTQAEISKSRLHLSEKEFELITVPDSTPAFIQRVFGIPFVLAGGVIAPFNAQLLLKPLDISRKELGRLLKCSFITNKGADAIVIQGEKIDADSWQNDIERVKNLTYSVLDRIQRFVRLWRKTGWSMEELDLTLTQLENAGVAAGIIPATVTAVGDLLRIQGLVKLSVEELCGLWYRIPAISIKENQKSLVDSLFNQADVAEAEGTYPKDAVKLIHPALIIGKTTASAEFSVSRLMAGFNRSDDEILALIKNLAQPLGIGGLESAVEGERGFNLTLANLSLLYRHSKMAEILKLSVGDLFRIIKLTVSIPGGYLGTLKDIYDLMDFHAWWKSTPYSIDEINLMLLLLSGQSGLTEKLLPLSLLFKNKKLNEDALTYVFDHPAVFGISNIDMITVDTIKKLHAFAGFIVINEDGSSNVSALSAVLDSYTNATRYQDADQKKLSALLQCKQELLAAIHPVVSAGSNAIEVLMDYKKISEVCGFIGIGGNILPKIISAGYDDLNEATQALLAAFRSKYKTESERKEKLEIYQDKLRGKKRAALTTILIHSDFPQFENENDLFHYFLIDTELEGCARTSRLVAATMSLQLYIHRILLNLEQDAQEPGTPGRVHVQADDLPGDEWSWRKNYRVWEANRKVFLYPENYIEPELRDDKSPLFEELESELLQQEINADTVLDAYAKYMRGFDEVSHLKIAGSYHEKDAATETDVLHLFGVTADEPPVYYYRRVENLYYAEKNDNRGVVWAPWQKISVQIPVRKVAPVTYNGRLYVFWVRVTTMPNTVFDQNQSVFTGYSHKFSIEFTMLKLDGTWVAPQKVNLKNCYPFTGNGVVQDPLADEYEVGALIGQLHEILRSFPFFNLASLSDEIRALKTPRYDTVPHYEPVDEYTLGGFMWDQIYPGVNSYNQLTLSGAGYQMESVMDFYNLNIQNNGALQTSISGFPDPVKENVSWPTNKPGKILGRTGNQLFRATSPGNQPFGHYAYGSLIVNTTKTNTLLTRHWKQSTLDSSFDNVLQEQIASLSSGTEVQIINGAYGDAIIDVNGDLLLIQGTPVADNGFIMKRIGTTLSETLTRTLFTSGIETTLSIKTQKALKEAMAPISITADRIENRVVSDKIDFRGAYGNYFREIYFHIPFLLANYLNSQGKYAEAQKWYHYIFNPTANEVIDFTAPGLTAAQKKKMELDRNWQYLEFRGIDTQKLKDQLTDKKAIEVYKKDPFNPHAIARLRLSAYQKSIVMKYVDNLLDWGDQLFSQDTMESINQATLLYVIAKEILGNRPAEIGGCGEGNASPKTYENIQPSLNRNSDFLAELESYTLVRNTNKKKKKKHRGFLDNSAIHDKAAEVAKAVKIKKGVSYTAAGFGSTMVQEKAFLAAERKYTSEVTINATDDKVTGAFARGTIRGLDWKKDSIYAKGGQKIPSFGWSIIRQVSSVFCVPGNKDLLDYYNRVDDRLYKIRNCMNLQGIRRQLALFAPEIDPRLMVRARAAGLSLDDILNSTSGNLPPYRFVFILEKAKAFTMVVQGFGASLLRAIEKRDGEELALLRITQQQNILELSSKNRQFEIDIADECISAHSDRIESLRYQIGYYEALIAESRNGWEIAQSTSRHDSTIISGIALPIWTLSGVMGLVPQVGSPFAMKYGGLELSSGARGFALAVDTAAAISEAVSASSGLEAGFDRRTEGWKHQNKQLQFELKQAEKDHTAAAIRKEILMEADKIHQKSIEHNQEVMDFYGEKFSGLGLYTWLSSTMQRLFKEAYNNALSVARLAEQAYRYERDDSTMFIEGSYFESSKAGLLAGERLLMVLQRMERKYLETNYRKNEIDQAFSLTQINPAALLLLKQSGSCTFNIPEIFYDLFYPGQYRRKIQSVRLTIPAITGPYTNVSATLSLMSSQIRMEPMLGGAELKEVPKSRATTISTSTAQNDAGVFQLNFLDDRYLPFEGAGAVSSWKLALPKNFRQFDYSTINDVIIHVSYTADYDELFRDNVEAGNDATEGTLINILKNNVLARTFSLRQEFSNDFQNLTGQPVNTPVVISIQNRHFPLFMNGKTLKVTKAKLVLVTPAGQTVGGVNISLDGASQTGFTKDSALGDLYAKDLGNLFNAGIIREHTFSILASGELDLEKLEDIILYVEYKIG